MFKSNSSVRSKQQSLKIIMDGRTLALIHRNKSQQFQCPPPCLLEMQWACNMQRHCKTCVHFLKTFNVAVHEPDATHVPAIATPLLIPESEQTATIQINLLNVPDQVCDNSCWNQTTLLA